MQSAFCFIGLVSYFLKKGTHLCTENDYIKIAMYLFKNEIMANMAYKHYIDYNFGISDAITGTSCFHISAHGVPTISSK